jgi:uncharacterized repeat protein (TIGR01451 family)
MSHMKIALTVGVIGIGLAVALARAQESQTREPGLFQVENSAPRPLEPTPAAKRNGAFIQDSQPSTSQLRSSAFDAPPASEANTEANRKPNAADRLKQVRSGGSASSQRNSAAISGPVTANPAELDHSASETSSTSSSNRIQVGEGSESGTYSAKGTVSVLKKPEGGAPADRTTARRLLRSTPKSSPSPATQSVQPSTPTATAPLAGKKSIAPKTDSTALASSQGATLRVDTEGPATLVVGKEAIYTVTISNDGTVPANEVLVRVGLPASLRVIADGSISEPGAATAAGQTQRYIWSVPRIEAKGSERFSLRVTAVENQPIELLVDWTTRPTPAVAQIQVQQPLLDLAVSGPRDVLFGETATYTVRISNPGTGDAEDVAVEFGYADFKLEPKRISSLAAGQNYELKVELNATQAGPLQVVAVATGSGGLRADATQDVLVRRAKLEVTVTGDPVTFAGSPAAYQIQVRNTGDAPATEVVAAIKVPQNAQAQIVGDSNKPSDEGLLVNIGSLPPNAERTIEMQCVLATPGENQIAIHAAAANQLAAATSIVTRVEALADLKLSVNDPSGPVAVGKEAVYQIQIVNRGTKAATKVTVVGQFSQGIEPIAATGGQAEVVPGQVVFQMIPRIEPGQELTLVVRARAESEGNKRFRAEVTSDESDTQLVAQETTYFYSDSGKSR